MKLYSVLRWLYIYGIKAFSIIGTIVLSLVSWHLTLMLLTVIGLIYFSNYLIRQ